jgi:hypothetical protein
MTGWLINWLTFSGPHVTFGSTSDPSLNGHLYYPNASNLDENKSNSDMFSYEKMFQDVSIYHDVNPGVSGICISSRL